MPPKKYLTTAPREMRLEITQKLRGGVRHFAGKPQQKADSQALLCELRQVAASAVVFFFQNVTNSIRESSGNLKVWPGSFQVDYFVDFCFNNQRFQPFAFHDVGLNNAKEVDESEKLRAELVAVEEVRWTLSTEQFRFLPKVLVGTLFGESPDRNLKVRSRS